MTDRQAKLLWAGLVTCGALLMLARIIPSFFNPWPSPLVDRDFSNLWLGGRLAGDGQANLVYDIAGFRAAMHKMIGANFAGNYSYPPHSLFLAIPFGALPYPVALVLWNVASVIIFYIAARPVLRGVPWWAVVFSPASLMCLAWGHYGLLAGALWLWSFRGNGWAAALLTIKPHIGLLVAVQFLRDRRGLATAVAGAAALILVSAAVFGLQPWREWLTTTLSYQVGLLEGSRALMLTSSVAPITGYGVVGQIFFAGAAIFLLWRSFDVFSAATATFLILPYGFHYDLTVVCFGFAVLLTTRWSELRTWQKAVASAAYLTPGLVTLGTWIAPPILLAGLYVQTSRTVLA